MSVLSLAKRVRAEEGRMNEDIAYTMAELLPHAPPMILLDRVVAYDEDFIHAAVTIRKGTPFFADGEVPSYIALEYMAQAVGAWNSLQARQHHKKPKLGFLIGSRRLTLDVPSFIEGLLLDVYGQAVYKDEEMASFDCWIEVQGQRVVSAALNVFQPKTMDI